MHSDVRSFDELEELMMAHENTHKLLEIHGPVDQWSWARCVHTSLADILIDVVYSIRMRHGTVDAIVSRWQSWLRSNVIMSGSPASCLYPQLPLGRMPGLLLGDVCGEGAGQTSQSKLPDGVLPRNRVAGRLKREIVAEVAGRLSALGIETVADMRAAVARDVVEVRECWLGVKGLGVGSWNHVRLLAGVEVVDPSAAVRRELGLPVGSSPVVVGQMVDQIARNLDVSPVVIEYGLTMAAGQSHKYAKGELAG